MSDERETLPFNSDVGDRQLECPHCHFIGSLFWDFDIGGFPDGIVFCNQCWITIDVETGLRYDGPLDEDDCIMDKHELDLVNRAHAALADLAPVNLEISPAELLMLIAQLQLALRHPGNSGESAVFARQWIRGVMNEMPAAVAELIALGFSRDMDTPGQPQGRTT